MNKYKRAIKKEIEWLAEDIMITAEMIRRIDNGENAGWSRQSLLERIEWAYNEKDRLNLFIHER